MNRLFLLLYILFFLFIGCSTELEYEHRLEGKFAYDPEIGFTKVYSRYFEYSKHWGLDIKLVDTMKTTDTIFIAVSEYNRSDGKACPAKGMDLRITLVTKGGDYEEFPLDTEFSFLTSSDAVTSYQKLFPKKFESPHKYNGILEIDSTDDIIVAIYNSYWHGHEVRDTVYYSN